MKVSTVLLLSALAQLSTAQTTDDIFGSLLSEAQSFVTSLLNPTTSSSSSPTTSSSSRTTSSTSSATSSSSPTRTSSSSSHTATSGTSASRATTSPAVTSGPSSATSAAQSSASAAAASSGSGGGGGSNTLAIVLGCTVGALAIAAFLALCFLCRRRRRRRAGRFAKHRALSPDDDEIESWRHEKPTVRSSKGFTSHAIPVGHTGAPVTSERDSLYPDHHPHQNPFVPVPPPPRKSVSRSGLHDATEYSAHPYSPDHVNGYQTGEINDHPHNHSGRNALAAGVGGAALGGLAAHAVGRHERKRSISRGRNTSEKVDPMYSEEELNTLPEAAVPERRSGSISRASTKEPWPFVDAQQRKSMESARSGNRSLSRSRDYFSTPDQHPVDAHPKFSGTGLVGAVAAGGLAGAIASRKASSRSPHRRGILKQTTSESSDPSSISSGRGHTKDSAAVNNSEAVKSGPHELETADIPPTPPVRERRDSMLGSAAPLAAAGAMASVNGTKLRRRRSTSRGSKHSPTQPPPIVIPDTNAEPPRIPNRSPRRVSIDSRSRYSTSTLGTAELPDRTSKHDIISPPLEPRGTSDRDALLSPISPVSESQNGSWSNTQARELGLVPSPEAAKPLSQGSTVVGSVSPENDSSGNSSETQSSGLVSAIQKIFNTGQSPWPEEETNTAQNHPPNTWDNDRERFRKVPRRKPAPNVAIPHTSQYGEIKGTNTETMPGAWTQGSVTPSQRNATRSSSSDSARSFSLPTPSRSRSRGRGRSINQTSVNDFAAGTGNLASLHINTTSNPTPTHPRPTSFPVSAPGTHSRSGYGIGSGDPFDLARSRTDSSMTGISLASASAYQGGEPASRPRMYRSSTGSDLPHPTLADLRREVLAEDRERARQHWRRSQSRERSESLGLRYGSDQELFDLVDQTTGSGPGRFYANYNNGGGSGKGQDRPRRASASSSVGKAY